MARLSGLDSPAHSALSPLDTYNPDLGDRATPLRDVTGGRRLESMSLDRVILPAWTASSPDPVTAWMAVAGSGLIPRKATLESSILPASRQRRLPRSRTRPSTPALGENWKAPHDTLGRRADPSRHRAATPSTPDSQPLTSQSSPEDSSGPAASGRDCNRRIAWHRRRRGCRPKAVRLFIPIFDCWSGHCHTCQRPMNLADLPLHHTQIE